MKRFTFATPVVAAVLLMASAAASAQSATASSAACVAWPLHGGCLWQGRREGVRLFVGHPLKES